MADLRPLTQQQQALLEQYHKARKAWEHGYGSADSLATTYAVALDACLNAGFDPFHYPAPQ